MRARLIPCIALIFLALSSTVAGAQSSGVKPSIYVGPQVRDGFVDIDSGIRDSIRDVKQALVATGFGVSPTRETARLILIVIGRGIVTNGSVGFGSSNAGTGVAFVLPNQTPTLATV